MKKGTRKISKFNRRRKWKGNNNNLFQEQKKKLIGHRRIYYLTHKISSFFLKYLFAFLISMYRKSKNENTKSILYIYKKNTTMLQNKPTLPPLGWLKGLILRIKNEFLAKIQFFAIFCNRSFVFSHYFQTTFSISLILFICFKRLCKCGVFLFLELYK